MIKKISSELRPLTRELALQFTQLPALPGERQLKPARLKFFEARLRDQTFNSPNWAKAIIEGDKIEKRADGQHTSHILSSCENNLFPTDLNVTVSTYHLDLESERARLFDLFDNPMSSRTNSDKMGVFVASHSNLTNLEKSHLAKIARGIDFYYRDILREQKDADITLFVSRDHGLYFDKPQNQNFAIWLDTWESAEHGWMISKPGIVAEIYADWLHSADLAGRFWEQVMTESNPDPEDDTRELSRILKEWDHKQPRVTQDKFRSRAKKMWERYRRMADPKSKAA